MKTLPMLVLSLGLVSAAACAKTDRYDNPPPAKPANVVVDVPPQPPPATGVVTTTGADLDHEKETDRRDAGALIPPLTVPAEMGTERSHAR